MNSEEIKYGQYTVPPAEDFVKFGVGQPSTSMLPLELIKEAGLSYMNSLTNRSVLQYGDIQGYSKFLEDLSAYLEDKYKSNVDPKHLFVSNGVTNALSLICSLFSSKNPLVLVEDPTYFLAKDIFEKDFNFEVKSIPMETDGININELEKILEENTERQVLLYIIPTFHNPTSYTLSNDKRVELGKLIEIHSNVIGIADEVYQLLYFTDDKIPPLPMCYYSDKFISLGSFSKILAPSLRMGWMHIRNESIMNIFVNSGIFDSSGGNTPFVQAIIHGILMGGELDQNIIKCRNFLHNNCTILANLVEQKLSKYVEFVRPSGGYFLWLKLKSPLTASALLEQAELFKIHFHSGDRFSVNKGNNFIRLSFSYYDADGIKIGIDRLEQLCEKVTMDMKSKSIIGIVGYKGKLGKAVIKEIHNILPEYAHVLEIHRTHNVEFIQKCVCILDVSRPSGTEALLDTLSSNKLAIPLVVGTTGLSKSIENKLYKYSETAPVAYISNFSKGIPLLIGFLDKIDENFWDISLAEKHHIHKVDSPSGTALTIASHINKHIPIQSIREGEVFGEHIVKCSTKHEELTIHHKAKTRDLFAVGAVEYLGWITEQKPGIYLSNNPNIKFYKYSGCGNDFIIIPSHQFTMHNSKKTSFIKRICERKFGIGADGVIEVSSNGLNKLDWTYYNNDGNTVEMCGNGARCIVQFGVDNNLVDNKAEYVTLTNNFGISQRANFNRGYVHVEMSDPCVKEYSKEYPSDIRFEHSRIVAIGVPHIVHKLNLKETSLSQYPLNEMGRISMRGVEANVNIYTVDDEDTISVRTYERGVNDETLACGSGCCAAAYDEWLRHSKGVEKEYTCNVASGDKLTVKISDHGQVSFGGKVTKVYSGVTEM